MRFPTSGSLLGAALFGLSQGTPINTESLATTATDVLPSVFNLAKTYVEHTLYKGVSAPAIPGVQAAVNLDLSIPRATIDGAISVEVSKDLLIEPTVRVNLGGVKIYLEVDVEASAAVSTSVELLASPRLSLDVPGLLDLAIGAAFGLDLLIGVSAAVDLEAGVYITLPDLAFVEINLLTKMIINSNLEGLIAKALPIALVADLELEVEVELTLGLRLRTHLGLDAGVHIPGLEIGAGADVAVWINLFDYTAVLIQLNDDDKDDCALSVKEVFHVIAGVAVDVDVSVGDVLDITIAPSVLVTLAASAQIDVCLPRRLSGALAGHPQAHPALPSTTLTATTLPHSLPTPLNKVPGSVAGGITNATRKGSAVSAVSAVSIPAPTGAGSDTGATALRYPNPTGAPASDIGALTTSTFTTTATYTITSCAASIPNCPASLTQKVVTSTVFVTSTVCPVSGSSTPSALPMPTPTCSEIPVTPVPTPATSTYTPAPNVATPAPTVTIVDTTTVCPESTVAPTSTNVYVAPTSTSVYVVRTSAGMTTVSALPTASGAPSGTGVYTTPKPSATFVTAGAGKVVGGAAAVIFPILAMIL